VDVLEVSVDAKALESYIAALLGKAGLRDDDALFFARSLVQTTLWGKDSHGVMRVPHYLQRLTSREVNPRPTTQIVRGGGAFEVMDGDNGPGYLVGRDAMLRAVTLAEKSGIGAVGVIESNHFGAAAIYARLAAERGMVGVAMTNSVPKMIAPGGTKPIVGSNPIAIAVPTYGEYPFVLDMSLSAVAGGRLLLAAGKGEKIPPDWATDKRGRPTDDPVEAFAGGWLPAGGVKGLGLAYAVDILCGLITGGAFGPGVKSQYSDPSSRSETAHMMIAINVDCIMDRGEMRERMAEYCATIKSSPLRDSSQEMLVPGERAHRNAQAAESSGIRLHASLYDELVALGEQLELVEELSPLPRDLDGDRPTGTADGPGGCES
jgi:LDH2 family malate/lactate/ureidoglycolate dehydrogenase